MTKKYYSPMLQVVSISKHDVIATSEIGVYGDKTITNPNSVLAPDRWDRFDYE